MTLFFDNKTLFWSYSCSTLTNLDLNINALDILYQNTLSFQNTYFKNELKKRAFIFRRELLERNSKFKQDELRHMKGDYEQATNESLTILSNFIIVATYSFYEQGLKTIMRNSKIFNETQIKNCFKNENILTLFNKKEFIENMKDNDDYKKVNEIRCLNNVIKHNGIVDDYLHEANPKWTKNEIVKNTYEDFLRLKDGVSDFLSELISKIRDNITLKK
jgi:hypothetical protein